MPYSSKVAEGTACGITESKASAASWGVKGMEGQSFKPILREVDSQNRRLLSKVQSFTCPSRSPLKIWPASGRKSRVPVLRSSLLRQVEKAVGLHLDTETGVVPGFNQHLFPERPQKGFNPCPMS